MSKPNIVIYKWLWSATPDQARELAKVANTSVAYLRHVAAGRRGMTADMAQRLAHASKQLHTRELYLDQRALCEACGNCPLVR
jgi:plasmid maintenance system antidote protein VapI